MCCRTSSRLRPATDQQTSSTSRLSLPGCNALDQHSVKVYQSPAGRLLREHPALLSAADHAQSPGFYVNCIMFGDRRHWCVENLRWMITTSHVYQTDCTGCEHSAALLQRGFALPPSRHACIRYTLQGVAQYLQCKAVTTTLQNALSTHWQKGFSTCKYHTTGRLQILCLWVTTASKRGNYTAPLPLRQL